MLDPMLIGFVEFLFMKNTAKTEEKNQSLEVRLRIFTSPFSRSIVVHLAKANVRFHEKKICASCESIDYFPLRKKISASRGTTLFLSRGRKFVLAKSEKQTCAFRRSIGLF